MLEYCKIVLNKLRFDRNLFRKEYRKSFKQLNPTEQQELKNWLREKIHIKIYTEVNSTKLVEIR